MGGASFQFLAFAFIAAIVYNLSSSLLWRRFVLLVANAYFLSTFVSNIQNILPLLGFLALGYVGVRTMQRKAGAWAYAAMLVLVIGVFVWLKKYTFLPSDSFLRFAYVTIGLSYMLFRVLHLMIDAHSDNLPEKIGLISYLNYTLSFMTLVSGPIQRFEEFEQTEAAVVRPPLTVFGVGEGLHRIVVGFFKVSVLSLILFRLHKDMLGVLGPGQSLAHRVLTGAILAVSYPLYLYFNFSGYMDLVIGIGRFFRFTLPENFDRPFFSDNFVTFWGCRWHITLSNWLRTYVFNPLLLISMRRISSPALEPFLVVPALFITFFLVGIWHGQTSEFLFFGFLQGFGVAINQLYQILLEKQIGRRRYKALCLNGLYISFSRGLTFTWFALTQFWFWSNWAQIRQFASTLTLPGVILMCLAVFLPATVLLSVLDMSWKRALALRWKGSSVALSPYTLTVVDTSLAIVSFAIVVLLHSAAPDIVYKAF